MEKMKGKKVLFVITKSNLGGAQKYVLELAASVQDAGGLPVVACGGTGEKDSGVGGLVDTLQTKNIPVHIITHFMRNMSPLQDMQALVELIRLIRRERPDVLHVTSSKAGGLGAFAGRLCRVPNIIFTSHGLTFNETWRPRYQRSAIKLLTWWTLVLAHRSIMISRDTYADASALPFVTDKIHLIYNGARQQLMVPQKEARNILVPHDTPTQNIWIGGIGELHPNKNWLLLIDAMATLPDTLHCVIIGEGEQRPLLEKRIAELDLQKRIHLTGFLQGAASLLPAFDIFVLPSKKEGLPYVLLEAGHARCAVACSAISGNIDIIQDGENGLLCTHTPESITHAISTLMEDAPLRKTLGNKLYADVHERFSMDTMVERTFALYQQ